MNTQKEGSIDRGKILKLILSRMDIVKKTMVENSNGKRSRDPTDRCVKSHALVSFWNLSAHGQNYVSLHAGSHSDL